MDLARSVFHMPVGEMLDRICYEELTYWLILQQMDPAGEGRADLRHAIGTAAFVNTQLANKRDAKKPQDYLAGEWLRKAWERNAIKRGTKKAFDGKAFWKRFRTIVNKDR